MKLKGISVFEQHAEKGVLALFVVVAAALFIMQFTSSNLVQVGPGEEVEPDRLPEVISQKAKIIGSRMQGDFEEGEGPPEVTPGDQLVADAGQWEGLRLAMQGMYGGEASTIEPAGPDTDRPAPDTSIKYVEVTPPAPSAPIAIAEAATIDPFIPAQFPAAASLLPDEQPLDEWYVSLQTSFDAPRFYELLGAIPDDEDILPLNPTWWQGGTLQLVRVVWERERLLPDGTWGERTTIDPLPGRDDMSELLEEENLQPARLPELLALEEQRRENIRRPQMYPIIAGPQWVFPAGYIEMHGLGEGEGGAMQPANNDCEVLQRRVRSIYNEIQRTQRAIERTQEDLNGGGPDRTPTGPGRGTIGFLDAPGLTPDWPAIPSGWMAQRTRPDPEQNDDRDAEERRRERLQRRLDQLRTELERLQGIFDQACAELDEKCDITCNDLLGIEDPNAPRGQVGPVAPVFDEPLAPLSAAEAPITLWMHDLGVVPGETYRYRATVHTINPFFGHAPSLSDEQKPLAESPTIASAPGAWGEPIETMPETFIQVVNASSASHPVPGIPGRPRPASADMQVYTFYYGYWRETRVSLDAGDLLIAEIETPEWPTYEIDVQEGQAPTIASEVDPEETLEIVSDLVMSDVFEPAGRRTPAVLFSTFDGRTRIATQLAAAFASMLDRSTTAAIDAVVFQPGTGRTGGPNLNRPMPGDRPPGRDGIPTGPGRQPAPTGPGRGTVPLGG